MCQAAEDAERLGAPGLVANVGVRRLLKSVMLLETALSEVLCETKENFFLTRVSIVEIFKRNASALQKQQWIL